MEFLDVFQTGQLSATTTLFTPLSTTQKHNPNNNEKQKNPDKLNSIAEGKFMAVSQKIPILF